MKIMIAEYQPQIVSALQLVVEQEEDVRLVGEIHSTESIMDRIKELDPDVLFLNWELPSINPFIIVPRIKLLFPLLTIVAISGRPEVREEAMALGVDIFFHRFERVGDLLEKLRGLVKNKVYELNPSLSQQRNL